MRRSIATGISLLAAAGVGLIAGARLVSSRATHNVSAPATVPFSTAGAAQAKRKILYWWDPMIGPSSISPKPGISALGMKLVPVYASSGAASPGEVTVDPAIEQDLAVQTSPVRRGALHKTVRTVGYFRQATPVSYAVTARVDGWIGALYASTNGTAIRKGDPLFTLYSPELLAAEEELLAAGRNRALARASGDARSLRDAQKIYQAIRRRLIYLGVSAAQLDRIVQQRRAQEYLTFLSPLSGYLSKVAVRQKSYIKSGQALMRIEQLSSVWLDAQVYDSQLPWIQLGEVMQARVAADPARRLEGRIFFIDPAEDPRTHTVTIRAQFSNAAGLLRPGMYALVDILTTPLKNVLLAPASAVIHTGTGKVVLVALGHGRFLPRDVTTGLTGSNGAVQVLSGLNAGEEVVTSGQFLIDVESNMRELTRKLTAGAGPGRQVSRASQRAKPMSGTTMAPARKQDGAVSGQAIGYRGPSQRPKTGG